MKKYFVKLETSSTVSSETISLEDMNISEDEWEQLTDEEKESKLQECVDGLPEQPYWVIDTWQEK